MRPLIGLSSSCLVSSESDRLGLKRYAVPAYYVQRVEEAGGLPVLLPTQPAERAAEVLQRLDGLLLTGGADVDPDLYGRPPHARLGEVDRARDLWEMALVRAAQRAQQPILAICRGMQVVNVTFGGALIQDIPSEVRDAIQHDQVTTSLEQASHSVRIEGGTALAGLAGALSARVNSYHHQAIDKPAEGFRATAWTSDGVVEAMEAVEGPFFQCVQWHPERLVGDPLTRALFSAFVAAARPLSTPTAAPLAAPAPAAPGAAPGAGGRKGGKAASPR